VPAHNYTYSFESKHDWTSVYASSAEIREYFKAFAGKYELNQYIKLDHLVRKAQWDEASGQWNIEVVNTSTGDCFQDDCAILINAGGYLNNWTWPNVPGREKFEGIMRHSADWDENTDIKGKKVILIGSGYVTSSKVVASLANIS
jgi:cation diffusion facilitator CzcD-associated flavoprotein CzcO